MPPPNRQALGSQDPFAQRGREPSLLEFLDWMISMGAGIGCALLLHRYSTPPKFPWVPPHADAWAVLATTIVVGAIDLLNKRTRMRLNLPAAPGSALFGLIFTLVLFGAAGALFYFHWNGGAFLVLLFMFMLTTAEMRQLRDKAARAQQAGASYPGGAAAAPHSGQARPTSPIRE